MITIRENGYYYSELKESRCRVIEEKVAFKNTELAHLRRVLSIRR
jgi:hypothetical protein